MSGQDTLCERSDLFYSPVAGYRFPDFRRAVVISRFFDSNAVLYRLIYCYAADRIVNSVYHSLTGNCIFSDTGRIGVDCQFVSLAQVAGGNCQSSRFSCDPVVKFHIVPVDNKIFGQHFALLLLPGSLRPVPSVRECRASIPAKPML